MPKLFVEKSIEISAPASQVWAVLTKRECTDQWALEFSSGGEFHIESDWKLGSPVLWKGTDGKTFVEGKVTELRPNQHIHFTITDVDWGTLPGQDDSDGITYVLLEKDGHTTLSISQGDFGKIEDGKKYYDMTLQVWDKVLPKVKGLADWIEKLQQEGFTDVRVCPIEPSIDAGEHTHDQHTVHVILKGELTIIDHESTKTFRQGDRVEFPAGTTHKARGGSSGGSMLVGVKGKPRKH